MSGALFQVLQGVVLAVLLLFSLMVAWRKLMPSSSRRALSRVARSLDRPRRSLFLRKLGRGLQPLEASRGQCGDGDGCSACAGCAPARSSAVSADVVPITIRPRAHR